MILEKIHMRKKPKEDKPLCNRVGKYLLFSDNPETVDCTRCRNKLIRTGKIK